MNYGHHIPQVTKRKCLERQTKPTGKACGEVSGGRDDRETEVIIILNKVWVERTGTWPHIDY